MRKILLNYCCVILLMFPNALIFSKEIEPPLPKTNPSLPQGLPINIGFSYLFIAGLAYGVYVIRKRVKD